MTVSGTDPNKKIELRAAIEIACRGLIYVSETDAPIVPFFREKPSGESLSETREKIKKEFGGECSQGPFEEFFSRLARDQTWHTPLQKRTVKKFRALRDLLRSNLTELAVYKLGRVRVDILVIGIDERGHVAGIHTRAVET
jgi:hypothetical protein